MKSNDKIIEEFRQQFRPEYAGGGSIKNIIAYGKKLKSVKVDLSDVESFILKALEQKEREVREKALNDFFQAVDARYKDFEITQAMGKILQKLKQPKE